MTYGVIVLAVWSIEIWRERLTLRAFIDWRPSILIWLRMNWMIHGMLVHAWGHIMNFLRHHITTLAILRWRWHIASQTILLVRHAIKLGLAIDIIFS